MDTTVDALPRLAACLLVLLLGSVIAVVARMAIERAPARVGRGPALTAGKLVFWGLLFLVVELALGILAADTAILVLAGAAVLAAGAFDVLREVATPLVCGLVAGTVALVGVFMALDEADIAPRVLNTLFLGLVLAAAGIAIVAIGGGGIQPMRARWEQGIARWQEQVVVSRARREELRLQREQRLQRRRHIDLRERAAAAQQRDVQQHVQRDVQRATDDTTLVPGAQSEDTTLVPAGRDVRDGRGTLDGDASSTQERIRAEIRSDTDTLP